MGLGSGDIQYIVCNMEPKKYGFGNLSMKREMDDQDQGNGAERGEQGGEVDPQRSRGRRRIKKFLRTSSRNGNSGGKILGKRDVREGKSRQQCKL